ncbi:MAG: argininosuccinate synthase [Alphaproteobacteria bacterium]|nr:argininosuccinate synthase [Alphaproteobacteria bacterium]
MSTAIIAFSGGLDTSFLVPYCREAYGIKKVITCTVNTGGFSSKEAKAIAKRSKEVGADKHVYIEAAKPFYEQIIKYLIYGNVTRDGYPLCVSAERPIVAKEVLDVCKKEKAAYFINGSTGAGNDQYRFDVATQVLGGGKIISKSPIREFDITRTFSADYLRKHNISITQKKATYSYNVGLWGISIGGGETHKADGLIPEDAWHSKPDPKAKEAILDLTFEKGELVELRYKNHKITEAIAIIQRITEIGNQFGYGRNYYLSTTTPGKKGRIAFESPAADLIYEAHRRLEAIVMTQHQITGKKQIAETFGLLLHEAKTYDPYMDDLKAFLVSSQRRVTGMCRIILVPGMIKAVMVKSPYNLLEADGAIYGESSKAYTGADAAGSSLLHGFEQKIYHAVGKKKMDGVYIGAAHV